LPGAFSAPAGALVLKEWVRVLKPGGLMSLAVPDFAKIVENYRNGVDQPTESYVMGGQVDADDYHRALFDKTHLTRLMVAAGVVLIEPWTSDLKDCAALPISLNLRGRKPHATEVKAPADAETDALLEQAVSLLKEGKLAEAASLYLKILARSPRHADALHLLGLTELQRKNASVALELIDRALEIEPSNATFLSNRGRALQQLKRLDEALVSYDQAVMLKPDYAEAFNNRGGVLYSLKRFEDAVSNYDRALAIRPEYPQALYNRGNALRDLRRSEEAIESYDRALAIKPHYPQALYNRGNALRDLRRLEDAVASYDRAVAVRPDYVEALANRGAAFKEMKRFDEALDSYERALAIQPDNAFLIGMRLRSKMLICDWRGLNDDIERLAQKITAGELASPPFPVLATPLSADLQRRCSEIYVREHYPQTSLLPRLQHPYRHDRIRLGYFSGDYRNHPVAYLLAEMFERHDRDRFELIAFSLGPPKRDAMRARVEKSFDRFIEVDALSDWDVASLARTLEVDIAIDLSGFTQDSRTGIFALGAAPIQVNYLGFPGTMGANYFDYLIADPTLIPEDEQKHYAEKIVYLPHTYQANDSARRIAERPFTRSECGLPENGFVFCCFNNSYKIPPDIFEIWMSLLHKVEGSVLWLAGSNQEATRNLRREAQSRGVAPERLITAPILPDYADHLARLRLADLFLDTVPYNAHATASDALWVGVPVLTCLGKTFPGRVAASLLKAVGLPELITQDRSQYESLALELSITPRKLTSLRTKLAANRLTHPLFKGALFTKHMELAYLSMWRRYEAGLAPELIHVAADE
jgi:predicted O-linked N-acetylglucosamine transferase (SPINDLY family)